MPVPADRRPTAAAAATTLPAAHTLTSPPRLHLAVQYACHPAAGAALPTRSQLRRWVLAALGNDVACAEITLRFVDAEEGRELNREFRGRGPYAGQKDYATNVLSFPYTCAPQLSGDLVLCWPVLVREASEQGKSLQHHAAHLIIHGLLHLQGHDHETSADAERMEALERRLLRRFRIPDPYQLQPAR